MILGIDPGKRYLGWGLVHNSQLLGFGLVRSTGRWDVGLPDMIQRLRADVPVKPDAVIVEMPRIYPKSRQLRVNDLLDLAAAAGACTGVFPTARFQFVWPVTWKGQTPKAIVAQRAFEELGCPANWPKNHNVLDGIAIAVWGEKHG